MTDDKDDGSYDFAPEDPAGEIPLSETEDIPTAAAEPQTVRKPGPAVPDRICPHCGFHIFGKTRGGRCPQCAAPLEHAATDLLQFSSPGWLRMMANGLLMVGAGIAAHVTAAVLWWSLPHIINALLHAGAAAVLLLGTLTATRTESGIGGKVLVGTSLSRWTALAALVFWSLLLLFSLGQLHAIPKWLTVLALACDGVFAIFFGLYNRALAERIPDDSLASQSLNVSWLAAAACLALVVIQIFELTTQYHLMFFFCSFPMIGGFFAVFAWSIIIVLRTAFELRASAVAGESIAAKRTQWSQDKKS